MTKHDHDKGEPRDSSRDRGQNRADEANQAESARVASLTPGDRPADGGAPVEPHTEMFPNQPHGQAGQPQNRPASEGHQGMTPIQPDEQELEQGFSPTQAITHGEPNQIVDTEYTVHAGATGAGAKAGHDKAHEHDKKDASSKDKHGN